MALFKRNVDGHYLLPAYILTVRSDYGEWHQVLMSSPTHLTDGEAIRRAIKVYDEEVREHEAETSFEQAREVLNKREKNWEDVTE